MAIGKASDFKIYNDQFFGGLVEATVQETSMLGALGINVQARPMRGDFDYQSFMKLISSLVTRRDTTSVSAATDLAVTMDENISVKLNRKIGPVAQTMDAWRKAALPFGGPTDDGARGFSRYLGAMIGKEVAVDMLNTSIASLRVALEAQATNLFTVTTGTALTTAHLNSTLSKMGDAQNRVRAWLMHSKSYNDLVAYQINPANNGDPTANGIVYGGMPGTFGRPIYVTDSASLVVTGAPDRYRIIGLTDGAIQMVNSEEQDVAFQLVSGLENLVHRLQGEFAYNLQIKGFKWDVANGGANPASAALTTATNWDKTATSHKDLAGVVLVVD
jgi:hypothetical protein